MSDQKGNLILPRKHQEIPLLMLVALRALSLLLIAAGLYFGWVFYQGLQNSRTWENPGSLNLREPPLRTPAQPKTLEIPSLRLSAAIVPLGLAPNGELQVPARENEIGWYMYGARPGENGPSVMVGHYDSTSGPAIFYRLNNIKVGDAIEVAREDGVKVSFIVTSREEYGQDRFPTEKVYGKTSRPALRLITCSGSFNQASQRYSRNLIVFAEKADSGGSQPAGN
jgi:hypothetical protein